MLKGKLFYYFSILILIVPFYFLIYYTFSELQIFSLIFTALGFAILTLKLNYNWLGRQYVLLKLVILILVSSVISLNANRAPYLVAYTYRYFFMLNLNIDLELVETKVNTEFSNLDGTEWGSFIESTYEFRQTRPEILAELDSKLIEENGWYGKNNSKYCPYVSGITGRGGLGSHTLILNENNLIVKLHYEPLVYGPIFKRMCL